MNKALKWKNIVTAWENSGVKATEWCKQNKIKLTTFKYWKYKFQRADDISIEFRELEHPPRRHLLKGDREGQIAVDLKHPFRLVFMPDNDFTTRDEGGNLDASKVTEIMIMEVTDYHD